MRDKLRVVEVHWPFCGFTNERLLNLLMELFNHLQVHDTFTTEHRVQWKARVHGQFQQFCEAGQTNKTGQRCHP